MKTAISFSFLFLFLIIFCYPVHGGVFGTATTIKPSHFALGLEPCLYFSGSEFFFYIHGGVGLTTTTDLDLKIGFGPDDEEYFGADVEFVLIPDTNETFGLSFAAGIHQISDLGLDTTLILSNRFRTFSLYGAFDVDYEFIDKGEDEDPYTAVYFDIGVAIPMARRMEFLLEGNIALTSQANDCLCGGIIFYF